MDWEVGLELWAGWRKSVLGKVVVRIVRLAPHIAWSVALAILACLCYPTFRLAALVLS